MPGRLSFEARLDEPYDRVLDRVVEALKEEGFGVLSKIDVKETLKEKMDADFRAYTILGACNPPLAHRALVHKAEMGLMLPCNVTVEESESGGAIVRVVNPEALLEGSGMSDDAVLGEVAAEAGRRLRRVAEAVKAASRTKTG
ncbi:MAG: DUF302 domain-containing protein [Thermoleophilia bacterium]|nr:DUF302 domain-containing protein [Thermoleophilia bacterium]